MRGGTTYKRTPEQKEKFLELGKNTRFKKGEKRFSGIKEKGEKSSNWKGGISKNPQYIKERQNRWIRNNPGKVSINNKKSRARRQGAVGSHTLSEWELLKIQYGFTCPCCYKSEPSIVLTEDHIIPLIKGGSNFIENIQPLCRSCNSKKHTKITKYEIC